MSRGVSVPSGAITVVYLQYECDDDDQDAHQWAWNDFRDNIAEVLKKQFPSLEDCKGWLGNEERIFLENQHAQVVISEYCGCVSVSLVPKEDEYCGPAPLATAWCHQVANNFEKVLLKAFSDSAMIYMGRASNGEQFFRPINRPEGIVTSKEGTLW